MLFAQPDVAEAVLGPADIAAQVILTPLLAGLSIWIGIAISTRSSDVRVAQQVSLLARCPDRRRDITHRVRRDPPTPGLVVGLTAVLLVADVIGWRVVAPMFDRERLVTGTR